MSNTERPLSPHLSIYRWPITMTLSILHRATGVAMAIGLLVLAAWLISAAAGQAEYERFTATMSTFVGQLLLVGWSFAFFYHLANGVRHLFWDAGRGFEKHQANASAWFVVVVSIAATALFWLVRP
jgi:succinate dehydrogenase / fumarate reductase cytochrome b subunit